MPVECALKKFKDLIGFCLFFHRRIDLLEKYKFMIGGNQKSAYKHNKLSSSKMANADNIAPSMHMIAFLNNRVWVGVGNTLIQVAQPVNKIPGNNDRNADKDRGSLILSAKDRNPPFIKPSSNFLKKSPGIIEET